MQLGLLVESRACMPNLHASLPRLRYGVRSSPATPLLLQRANVVAVNLSSSASLFSRLSVRGGLLPLKGSRRINPVRAEASGAYSKEAFVSEGEAGKLAQVRECCLK